MENKKNNQNFREFYGKFGYIFGIVFAIAAVLFLLAPVVSFEIRERVYDALNEQVSKTDYAYNMNLISYFTTGYKLNFTMYIVLGLALGGIIFIILGKFVKNDLLTVAVMCFAVMICFLILAREFFAAEENDVLSNCIVVGKDVPPGGIVVPETHGAQIAWGGAVSIFFASLAFMVSLSCNLQSVEFSVRDIAEEAIMIALAFGLNFIKIPVTATGGSVNFQMFPLMIIALRHGPSHGFVCGGIVYGLLTCLTDGYGFATYPFDYLIGFGSVAVVGYFRRFIFSPEQKNYNIKGLLFLLLAGLLSTIVRFVGGTTSSMVIYGYDLKAAMIYNSLYVLLSGVAGFGIIMAMYGPLLHINNMFPVKRNTY